MKKILRILLWTILSVAGTALLLVAIAGVTYLAVDRTNGKIETGGGERRYLLYVPESYDPQRPTALVISFHGYAQWPRNQSRVTGWNELADEFGFLVVHPSGTGLPKRWKAYSNQGDGTTNPDVTFIADLIDELEGRYNIDPRQVYANGLSNGAGMSVLLACSLSERIAAVGLVAGAYLLPWEECNPSRPVPAMVFHGTADPVVPYHGGPSHSFNVPFPDIPTWVAILATQNGCAAETALLPAQGAVSGVRYTHCLPGGEVVFYTIEGGGHTWPGGDPLPEFITGETSRDINATRLLWEFFQAHPLP